MPLFSVFLFEKFLLFKPPWSKQAPGLSHNPAWLPPKNPAADPALGLGASAALVSVLVPGTLLSLSTFLTVWSFTVLYLWSLIFIYAGILLAVHSVPQISKAFHWCRREVDSAPTCLAIIFHSSLNLKINLKSTIGNNYIGEANVITMVL